VDIFRNNNSKIICVSINGAISAALTPEEEKSIRDLLKEDIPLLLFDLSSLGYLGSASLRVILEAARKIRNKQGKVVLCCPNRYVREIFEVSGFGHLLPIEESVEEGINVHSPYWD
jgi:anti-anti-sigma factor